MVAPKKPIQDQILKDWLLEFKNPNTKQNYLAALRKFKKNLGIKSLDKYLKQGPDATKDIKKFLISLDGKPSKTIAAYTAAVKSFFVDNNVHFDETQWKKLKRRGFMPKRIKASTRDRKPTKQQLKRILNYLDVKGRAQVLFLLSSGCRIGESLRLLEEDINLESEPPRAHIRAEYTKNGVGARTVYFSYEARDAIKDWLTIKSDLKKRNGKKYRDGRVFGWSKWTARDMWTRALRKANLDEKDHKTERHILHFHSLRKFFRTKIGLDVDIINALMGHSQYLDEAYLRLEEKGEIAEAYKEAMSSVSVYDVESPEITDLAQENEELRGRIEKLEKRMRVAKIQSSKGISIDEENAKRLAEGQEKIIEILRKHGLATDIE